MPSSMAPEPSISITRMPVLAGGPGDLVENTIAVDVESDRVGKRGKVDPVIAEIEDDWVGN